MKQRKPSRRPTKKFKSSFAGKRPEGAFKQKKEKPYPAYITRVSKAGKTYRVPKRPRQQDPEGAPTVPKPIIPLRLVTTPVADTTATEQSHRQQRQAAKGKNSYSDRVNKLLILGHLTNRTTSKEKVLQIVKEIHSRGLRQRLLKKVRTTYGGG